MCVKAHCRLIIAQAHKIRGAIDEVAKGPARGVRARLAEGARGRGHESP